MEPIDPNTRLELIRRVKASLETTLDSAGVTPEEMAEQDAELIEMSTIIVDELGIEPAGVDPSGRVLLALSILG